MCSLIEDKDLVLVHYHTPSTQLLPQPQPVANTMDVSAANGVVEVPMPQAPQVPMPQAAQAASRAGPSPLGRAAHLAHAHAASSSSAPAASSPLAPSSAAAPLFSALGAAPIPPTAPTNLSPHAAPSSHATLSAHAAFSPHANLSSAASTPTSLSDAQHTIHELEARIRQP